MEPVSRVWLVGVGWWRAGERSSGVLVARLSRRVGGFGLLGRGGEGVGQLLGDLVLRQRLFIIDDQHPRTRRTTNLSHQDLLAWAECLKDSRGPGSPMADPRHARPDFLVVGHPAPAFATVSLGQRFAYVENQSGSRWQR